MVEAVLVKSNNASKKRKCDGVCGNKSKKSFASTSSAKISESFEDSLSSLLMSNVPTFECNNNEGKATAYNPNEGREGVIKRTFLLGGTKYVIFQGSQGLIENIYLKEWEDGTANGKKYPTPEGIPFKFNEWNEFIKVAQRMYTEYSEIYSCEPCILDEDSSDMI